MKTLFIDCGMGAAGDMLTAALFELLPDKDGFLAELNGAGIPGAEFRPVSEKKNGVLGTHMHVVVEGEEEQPCEDSSEAPAHGRGHHHDHEHAHAHGDGHCHEAAEPDGGHSHEHGHHHAHRGIHDIDSIVTSLNVPEKIKHDVRAVFSIVAEAEAEVHGETPDNIHFHELGTMDAIADITAVCMLVDRLAPDRIAASPVHVGAGFVHCAHGVLPVPAPATALILKNVPIYGGRVQGELCTPTGAALLKYFVDEFGRMPVMKPDAIGYGLGTKDFPGNANMLRVMIGEQAGSTDEITGLECNIDDMSAEEIAYAQRQLLDAGALDVFTQSIYMKKNRPGTLLTVFCKPEKAEEMSELIFRHTSTLGVRESVYSRRVLDREFSCVQTPYGSARLKRSFGYGSSKEKFEFDDLSEIAENAGVSLREARAIAEEAEKNNLK